MKLGVAFKEFFTFIHLSQDGDLSLRFFKRSKATSSKGNEVSSHLVDVATVRCSGSTGDDAFRAQKPSFWSETWVDDDTEDFENKMEEANMLLSEARLPALGRRV